MCGKLLQSSSAQRRTRCACCAPLMGNTLSIGIQSDQRLRHKSKLTCVAVPGVQVQADSNFADLGADSLDTVSVIATQRV